MAMTCPIEGCHSTGMCKHKIMMMAVVVIIIIVAAVYLLR